MKFTNHQPRVLALIPARLDSTRLPGKLLLSETGKPLIQHTFEAASRINAIDDVVVATDSRHIADTVRDFGGTVVMTGLHDSGTARIAEAIRLIGLTDGFVVNIQGDEPEISAEPVEAVIALMLNHPEAAMATAMTRFTNVDDVRSRQCVKVVTCHDGRALYFSRSVIPSHGHGDNASSVVLDSRFRRHVGIYGYQVSFLKRWQDLPGSELADIEQLEQLRPLQAGESIYVAQVEHTPIGIDTRADYDEFVARCEVRQIATSL